MSKITLSLDIEYHVSPNHFTLHLDVERPKNIDKFLQDARAIVGVEEILYTRKYSIVVEKGKRYNDHDVASKILKLLEEHLESESSL